MSPELEELIKRSREYVDSLTPEQLREMIRQQCESWVRAEMSWPRPKYKWIDGVKVYDSYEDYCND